LSVLRSHGLNDAALQTVYRAVIVARLTYATSAWLGFTTYDDRQRIEGLLSAEFALVTIGQIAQLLRTSSNMPTMCISVAF